MENAVNRKSDILIGLASVAEIAYMLTSAISKMPAKMFKSWQSSEPNAITGASKIPK